MGVLLWRYLMPQRNHNMDTQLHSLRCTTATKLFWKIYFLCDFWCTQTCSFQPFLDYLHEVLHLLLALWSDVWKKLFLYRCTTTFSDLNHCGRILLKYFCYIYEDTKWCTQTYPPIFRLFAIFNRNFAKIVVPPSNKNKNYHYLAYRKGQSLVKKTLKTASKSTHKQRHKTCSKYISLERTARQPQSMTKKRHTNTTFSHLQLARVVRSPPIFAWW